MATKKKKKPSPPATIKAMPIKELFIEMLTKDISLVPAIIDLVDNSVDGAKRIRDDRSFKDLTVRLEVSRKEFRISDNCGGITVDNARNYAFRFGRHPDAKAVKHSVGRFGVGMKRSIFKLGTGFRVESKTRSSHFVVETDVNEWAKDSENWQFEFSKLNEDIRISEEDSGTSITVTPLHNYIADIFAMETFITQLNNELQAKLQYSLDKGLVVTLNGMPINARPLKFLSSKQLAPAYRKLTYSRRGQTVVHVRLFCGLGSSEIRKETRVEAGWYVFCNGRLILEADKTGITGWGAIEEAVRLPGLHGQYNHFRGCAYFDCDDPARLPWNTTKTGLDIESDIYRAAKLEMMKLAFPVKNFLDKLKREKDTKQVPDELGPLESLIENAPARALDKIKTRPCFETPRTKPAKRAPSMQRIQYDMPSDQVAEVKKALKATSFTKVGERTFRYFYDAEIGE